jgi:hypothetical protein
MLVGHFASAYPRLSPDGCRESNLVPHFQARAAPIVLAPVLEKLGQCDGSHKGSLTRAAGRRAARHTRARLTLAYLATC